MRHSPWLTARAFKTSARSDVGHNGCTARNVGQPAPAEFQVELRGDVVVVVRTGAPLFEDTQKAVAAAVAAARNVGTKKILFDVRRADLTNFYSYIVRDVNFDPLLGLDTSFRICVVGSREQVDVMSFIVRVRQMRGWEAKWFFDMDDALKWLSSNNS